MKTLIRWYKEWRARRVVARFWTDDLDHQADVELENDRVFTGYQQKVWLEQRTYIPRCPKVGMGC